MELKINFATEPIKIYQLTIKKHKKGKPIWPSPFCKYFNFNFK